MSGRLLGQRAPSSFITLLAYSVLLLPLPCLFGSVSASDVIYKYVDDNGVPNFSGDRGSVPPAYQDRVEMLDAVTLRSIHPPAPATATSGDAGIVASPEMPAKSAEPSWLDRFASATIRLPSQFQLGVGLTTLALLVGIMLALRVTHNRLVKLLLRSAILCILGATVYITYVSGINTRLAETTGQPSQRTTTGQDMLNDLSGKADRIKSALGKAAANNPAQGAIGKVKAATVGEATQAANATDRANQQLDQHLREIETNR